MSAIEARRTLAVLTLVLPLCSMAHEVEEDAVPDGPGWRLGAGVALSAVTADQAWPVSPRPGVLMTGERARDRSGELSLEHAVLGLGARLDRRWSAQVAWGLHDRDAPHVEVARLQGEWPVSVWAPGERLRLRLGRQSIPLGSIVAQAGQMDAFAQPPLAKQAVINETWIDDGATLQWQAAPTESEAAGVRQVEVGLWRARSFPAGPHGRIAPSLRAMGQWGHWQADLSAAWLNPEGRGAASQGVGVVGHSHAVPDCRVSLVQRVCFDDQTQIWSAGLATDSADGRWRTQVAGMWRREQGDLYSVNGRAAYGGDTTGAWLQTQWRWTPTWQLAGRLDRLQLRHTLTGPGATLLATEAGFTGTEPVTRASGALGYSGWAPFQMWVEAGQERARDKQAYAAVRLLWQQPKWLEGQW